MSNCTIRPPSVRVCLLVESEYLHQNNSEYGLGATMMRIFEFHPSGHLHFGGIFGQIGEFGAYTCICNIP